MKKENILGIKFPELTKEWHAQKNENLTPMEITYGSDKKVWWVCEQGHEWQASPYKRSNQKRGCPYCAGKRVSKENALSTTSPQLLKEWHPTKNGTLTPINVSKGSHKKAWWVCEKGHEWETVIYSRKTNGCPYCAGQLVSEDNSLLVTHPHIAKLWHPTKNGKLTPLDVTPGSNKIVWWKCEEGHEWKSPVTARKRGGCAYCAGQRIQKKDSFGENNKALLREWDYDKNDISPYEVSSISQKTVWWRCENAHSFESAIKTRVNGGRCPYCSGKKRLEENRLDLAYPELLDEWHPTKNGDLRPSDFTYGSYQKVWWICPKGHEWATKIYDRTTICTGCPTCHKSTQTSFPEQILLFYLKKNYPKAKSRSEHVFGEVVVETDIYIPELNLAIEYDGYYFHRNKQSSDLYKNKVLYENSIPLIRIREKGLPSLTDYNTKNILNIGSEIQSRKEMVKELFKMLNNCFSLSISTETVQFDIRNDRVEIINNYKNIHESKNLTISNPEIAKEWNYAKNLNLTPESFTAGSGQSVWWKCDEGHEWQAAIYTRKKNGCPHCSGRIVEKSKRLPSTHSQLVKEWDYEKNGDLKPEDFSRGSSKRVWWKCEKKGHSFDAKISNRAILNRNCPYCTNKKVCDDNCLQNLYPKIAKEWHPTKNGDLAPNSVVYGSNKKVWWKCKKGHEWQSPIGIRTSRGTGCRECYKQSKKKTL
jgi:hypothetical protein